MQGRELANQVPEKAYVSGGEVRVIPLLDKITPQFWAIENQRRMGNPRPVLKPELESVAAAFSRVFRGLRAIGSEAPTPAPWKGELSTVMSQRELIDRYVREGQRLQAETLERMVVGAFRGIGRLFGWLKGLLVHPRDLTPPPVSR